MQFHDFSQLNLLLSDYAFIVIDKDVYSLYAEKLSLREDACLFLLDNAENSKDQKTYFEIIETFLERGITREDKILSIGGGATSDLAGFVAATILRGVAWVCIPTTLLSMVDAAWGGKTGINTFQGKNLVGAFHKPDNVLLNTRFLETLPEKELLSGKGEILKYAFLSKEIFQQILEEAEFVEIIKACAKYKEAIVKEDFQESGIRRILNLGHSFGHALEKGCSIAHGLAVAMGIEIICKLYSPQLEPCLEKLKFKLGIHYELNKYLQDPSFWTYLEKDKKRKTKGRIELIIPDEVEVYHFYTTELSELKTSFYKHEDFKNLPR